MEVEKGKELLTPEAKEEAQQEAERQQGEARPGMVRAKKR